MSNLDVEQFWTELESLGEDEVRKRIALGIYNERKLPLVHEWLRRLQHNKIRKNLVEEFFTRVKENPILSAILIFVAIVIASEKFFGASERIWERVHTTLWAVRAQSVSDIKGETRWVFAGYFNEVDGVFAEGPHVFVVETNSSGGDYFVKIGETIALKRESKLIVVDFKNQEDKYKFVSPIAKSAIDENDETGVILPKGSRLLVRDFSVGKSEDAALSAFWLRVVDAPQTS